MPDDRSLKGLVLPGWGIKVVKGVSEYDKDYWNGRLLMWEKPLTHHEYGLGVDIAEGVGKDRSVIQVIRMGTIDRPDEQVAEYVTDFLDPIEFAAVINVVGRLYSHQAIEAFLTLEANGPGRDLPNHLRMAHGYDNQYVWKIYDKIQNIASNRLGWFTTQQSRKKLVSRGVHAVTYGDLIVNSPLLLDEMADFHGDLFSARQAAARANRHDDRVMALLMGYVGLHDEEWLAGEDISEQRRLLGYAKSTIPPRFPEAQASRDWQNTAVSLKQMTEDVDNWIHEP